MSLDNLVYPPWSQGTIGFFKPLSSLHTFQFLKIANIFVVYYLPICTTLLCSNAPGSPH